MDLPQRLAIKELLRDRLKLARDEYTRSSHHFRQVVADAPSDIPAPDGVLQIKQAGADSRRALAQYMTALSALHNFAVTGILPHEPGTIWTPGADCEECLRLWKELGWATNRVSHLEEETIRLSHENPWTSRLSTAKTKEAEKALAAATQALDLHRNVAGH